MPKLSLGLPTALLLALALAAGCKVATGTAGEGDAKASANSSKGKGGGASTSTKGKGASPSPSPSGSSKPGDGSPDPSGSPGGGTGGGSSGGTGGGSSSGGGSTGGGATGGGTTGGGTTGGGTTGGGTTGGSGSPAPGASSSPTAGASSSPSPGASSSPAPGASGSPSPGGSASPSPGASASPGATLPGGATAFVGQDTAGRKDGSGTAAQFTEPQGLAFDANGVLYVADTGNNIIRKITTAGAVTTIAGNGVSGSRDGQGISSQAPGATFRGPMGLAVTTDGTVYVADTGNHLIRKITAGGVVSTVAGTNPDDETKPPVSGKANGNGTAASFNEPSSIAVTGDGTIYVADTGNNRIRKIAPNGDVTDFAGNDDAISKDGQGTAASFAGPIALTLDGDGVLWVVEREGLAVRKITSDGTVTTVKSGGFTPLRTITPDGKGAFLIADIRSIKKVTTTGTVTDVKTDTSVNALAVRDGKIYTVGTGENYIKTYPLP